MYCFFTVSYSSVFFPINDFNFILQGLVVPLFFFIYDQPYLPFQSLPNILTFDDTLTLPQQHGMELTQFLVMLYSVRILTWKRYFRSVLSILNIVLISYGLHIFWIFSARHSTFTGYGESLGVVVCRSIKISLKG